jgi:hypothetical protein
MQIEGPMRTRAGGGISREGKLEEPLHLTSSSEPLWNLQIISGFINLVPISTERRVADHTKERRKNMRGFYPDAILRTF